MQITRSVYSIHRPEVLAPFIGLIEQPGVYAADRPREATTDTRVYDIKRNTA